METMGIGENPGGWKPFFRTILCRIKFWSTLTKEAGGAGGALTEGGKEFIAPKKIRRGATQRPGEGVHPGSGESWGASASWQGRDLNLTPKVKRKELDKRKGVAPSVWMRKGGGENRISKFIPLSSPTDTNALRAVTTGDFS